MSRNRLHREDPSFVLPSPEAALRANPYMPPEDVVQMVVSEDDELSLWAVCWISYSHTAPSDHQALLVLIYCVPLENY
ncbi:hypothetical protein EON65_40225 [archaeon]|nr:MAG: hypothetical protein EON65_40225 [archaeon]